MNDLNGLVAAKLEQRQQHGTLRKLKLIGSKVDFTSNDYLGFARSSNLRKRITEAEQSLNIETIGSTGSRLLSGNSLLAEKIETQVAAFHDAQSAIIFNSGYDANVGLFSSLGRVVSHIVYDELIHASVHDGMRLSRAEVVPFRHNDTEHLGQVLKGLKGQAVVAVESIYSMDGDRAPLSDLVKVCKKYNAELIVDEAHAVGIFGPNGSGIVAELGLQDSVYARLVTFGKALGCHGAAVLGTCDLKQYLINYARPLIFSTFMSNHALISIECAYDKLSCCDNKNLILSKLMRLFNQTVQCIPNVRVTNGPGPIQCVIVPGNKAVRQVAMAVQDAGFDVRPIVAPTVAEGTERIRICLHEFNTEDEVKGLISSLQKAIENVS